MKKKLPEEKAVALLKKAGLKISTAESCTGGLVAGTLINVAGASDVFDEGFITYSNRAKRKYLKVKKTTLKRFGAVSIETAREMARGVARHTGSDVGLSTTGIAGPDGGTKKKPVGLVYIGCHVGGRTKVRECHFSGSRQHIRWQAVSEAVSLLTTCLKEYNEKLAEKNV